MGAAEADGRAQRLDAEGLIPTASFYEYYYQWLELDSITVATIQAQNFNYTCASVVRRDSETNEPSFTVSGPGECADGTRGDLTYAFISLYIDGLKETEDFTRMITAVRGVCDKYAAQGLPNFPAGQPFTFWEQYVHIWGHLLRNIGSALAVVCVCSLALLVSPVAAALITLTILITAVEIGGTMGLVGIKLSAIPVVSLIMSVGIAVEFTVHLVRSTTLGSRGSDLSRWPDHAGRRCWRTWTRCTSRPPGPPSTPAERLASRPRST